MSESNTFAVEVPELGTFVFRRRTISDNFWIDGEATRLTGGPVDDPLLGLAAKAYATLLRLLVEAPPGWVLRELNPYSQKAMADVFRVAEALGGAEARFLDGAS